MQSKGHESTCPNLRLLCLERSSPQLFVAKCMGFTCAIEKSGVHISQELVLRRDRHEGSQRGASPEMLRSVPDPAFLSSPAETSWNRSPRAPRLHACARPLGRGSQARGPPSSNSSWRLLGQLARLQKTGAHARARRLGPQRPSGGDGACHGRLWSQF